MQKNKKKNKKDLKESKRNSTAFLDTALDDVKETKKFISRLNLQRHLLENFIDPSMSESPDLHVSGDNIETDKNQLHKKSTDSN
jgi:hypothetical protein